MAQQPHCYLSVRLFKLLNKWISQEFWFFSLKINCLGCFFVYLTHHHRLVYILSGFTLLCEGKDFIYGDCRKKKKTLIVLLITFIWLHCKIKLIIFVAFPVWGGLGCRTWTIKVRCTETSIHTALHEFQHTAFPK